MTMLTVKTHPEEVNLPQASLYKINPDNPNGYIVETDPRFTDRSQWLGSDYMLNELRYAPEVTQKRLGDGFYEQRLINEQINRLTGRRFIEGYNNDAEQYRALMNNGMKYAERFNLSVGMGLTAKQMSELTTDMVWLVNKEVTLADGKKVTALVPQVYLVARNSDITSFGAVISANEVIGNVDNVQNSGVKAGRDLTRIHSNQLENRGTILGDSVDLSAKQTLINLGGKIEAVKALSLSAGEKLEIASTLSSSESQDGHFSRTQLDRVGSVRVTGEGGSLALHSDGNLSLKAANVESAGTLKATAGDSLQITTLKKQNREHYNGDGDNYYRLDQAQEVGSVLSAKENMTLVAQNNATLRQAEVSSENGKVLIGAVTGDVNIEAGRAEERLATANKSTSKGLFSKTTTTSRRDSAYDNAVGTTLSGNEITFFAGNDLNARNVQAIADKGVLLQAGNNVTIAADTNHFKEAGFEKKTKSGVLSGGNVGVTFGKRSVTRENDTEGWQQSEARNTLGSLSGNITVSAGNHAHLSGTDAIVSREQGKQILVEGKSTYVGSSEDELNAKERHEYKQSGLTVSFSSAVTDSAIAANKALKRSDKVQGERLGTLLKVKAANEAVEAVEKAQQVIESVQKAQEMNEATSGGDVKVSVSVGASQSTSTSITQQKTHLGSELDAHKVIVRATDGDTTIEGSKINAVHTELEGKNVNLLATQDSRSNRTDNQNSSWSVGVFVGKSEGSTGIGVEGAATVGKGHSNSDSLVHNNTEINSKTLKINAKETTTLKGAVANIDHLKLDTKNLHIESLQDMEKYDSKQTQGGVSGSAAIYGSGWGVSAQTNQNKANVDYAQVAQQSGFNIKESSDINVTENTHLKGGVIKAEDDKQNHRMRTGTLTTEEIENRSEIKVSSMSAGLSTSNMAGYAMNAALSALGNMSESERSQTKAAVSSNIDLQITDSDKQKALTGKTAEETLVSLNRDTANANGRVEKQYVDKVKERQEAAQIVAEIGTQRVGDLAQTMGWKDGSPEKMALHGLVGYLSAKVGDGNTASGTLSAMGSEYINTEITNYLRDNTALTPDERKAIQQATAAGIGALIGAGLEDNSNTVKQSAQMALRTEQFNRQLHPDEQQRIEELAHQLAKEKGKTVDFWKEQLTLVASAMVDEEQNQQITQGVNAILNDTVIYNLDDYKESLVTAYDTLKNEANRNQAIKWKDGSNVVLYGENVNMFQATEKQYKDSAMFGKVNYPNTTGIPRNNLNSLNEIGSLNGLDSNADKYSSELLGNIVQANRNRQDNKGADVD